MQPGNPGLTSGLPRVVQGLSADVVIGDLRGQAAEQVSSKKLWIMTHLCLPQPNVTWCVAPRRQWFLDMSPSQDKDRR
jgi:hypothetical protein